MEHRGRDLFWLIAACFLVLPVASCFGASQATRAALGTEQVYIHEECNTMYDRIERCVEIYPPRVEEHAPQAADGWAGIAAFLLAIPLAGAGINWALKRTDDEPERAGA